MGHRAFSLWKFPPISTASLRLASFVWSWRSCVSVWENFVVPGQQEPCRYHGDGGLWWDEISWSQNSVSDCDEGGFCATQVAPGAGLLAALALALRDGRRGKREGWSCTLIPLASFFFAGTHWGNSSESLCATSSTFISGKSVQPGSKLSLPLFSVSANQKMWVKKQSWRENQVPGSGCSLELWADAELQVILQDPNTWTTAGGCLC